MTRWRQGEAEIERLLDDRHVEAVAADSDVVTALIAAARRHASTAGGAASSDPEGALALAYDGARKAATVGSPPRSELGAL